MRPVYLVITCAVALSAAFSAVGKIRHDPRVVAIIRDRVGVPLEYFPMLAACELAGAVGLLAGIWIPALGVAAAIGLVVYFVGAIASHLRVGDIAGLGPAAFMLFISAAALVLRIRTM
jgi:hypothetical protein